MAFRLRVRFATEFFAPDISHHDSRGPVRMTDASKNMNGIIERLAIRLCFPITPAVNPRDNRGIDERIIAAFQAACVHGAASRSEIFSLFVMEL